jgi:predicted DNA-binding transcriptional regulator AlpA
MHLESKWMLIMSNEEYWTIKEFCGHIKVGRTTVWNGVKSGRFPKPVKICGLTRWKRSEVETWLDGFTAQRETN